MYPLIIIVGPTAVGKSALGIDLALAVNGEIISGDSVQIYRGLNIGSAKPAPAELQTVPHHLVGELDPDEPFTAARFQTLARERIQMIRQKHKIPIIVGGTGLYIRSLLDPYTFSACGSAEIRAKWSDYLRQNGPDRLHARLAVCDPVTAARLHPHDSVRIIRALEVYELTGAPFSAQQTGAHDNYPELDPGIIYVGLTAPRPLLYERINQRCRHMLDAGLIGETTHILAQGYSKKLKPLQSIGYRHAIWYLDGLVTAAEMLRLLQRDTRHFAKRQLTWFRRDPRIKWYDTALFSADQILSELSQTCRALKTRVE